jgi:hypothetical protein
MRLVWKLEKKTGFFKRKVTQIYAVTTAACFYDDEKLKEEKYASSDLGMLVVQVWLVRSDLQVNFTIGIMRPSEL